ncbi:MAG: GMC family oxidoreductase N-terminal domain-containing protein [Steroidobacteraceae bacterium]
MSDDEADLIVVGGGSAGCALAARLAEATRLSILLLEAGRSDRHPFTRIPAATGAAIFNPHFNWMHQIEPDASRNGAIDMWPAGRCLGGGSAINGMMFIRGHAHDFDGWAQGGCLGWAWTDVLPYFRRLERNSRGGDRWRGGDGPVSVADARDDHPLIERWIEAAVQAGIARSADLNGAQQEGVDRVQASQCRGWRHPTSKAYIWSRPRSNLRLRLHTEIVRVVFEGSRAVAVEWIRGGVRGTTRARAGVVLSAGALATPKILMHSGIGPQAELARHGLACHIDASEVGRNLQEHPGIRWQAPVNVPTLNMGLGPLGGLRAFWRLLSKGEGPLTLPIGQAQALVRSSVQSRSPDVQIIMSALAIDVTDRGGWPASAARVDGAIGAMHPCARGYLRLRSADPADKPQIHHQLLGDERDVATLIRGGRLQRRILSQPAFKRFLAGPGSLPDIAASDDEWRDHVRQSAFPMYHPVGTCRMGSDERAVLDPRLHVRGVERLWVADASIMPSLPGANTNAAAIMIGERAADLIREDCQ